MTKDTKRLNDLINFLKLKSEIGYPCNDMSEFDFDSWDAGFNVGFDSGFQQMAVHILKEFFDN